MDRLFVEVLIYAALFAINWKLGLAVFICHWLYNVYRKQK